MKTLLLPAAFALLAVSACGTTLAAADPSPLATCPGPISTVQVEGQAGKYNPPAFLAPTWDNGRVEGKDFINLYSEWTDLANQEVTLHCHYADGKVVKVAVPARANKCTRFRNEVSCFVAPAKSGRAAKPASPAAKP